MEMKYSRILLKLSGESLAGKENHGISDSVSDGICRTDYRGCPIKAARLRL